MRTPEQNIIKTFKGKKLLCIENDNGLDNGVDTFQQILEKNGIEHRVIYDASNVPIEEIIAAIDWCDGIFFMTQWVYEISKKILEYVRNYQRPLDIIEICISEPTWYYKHQAGADQHNIYWYRKPLDYSEDWERFFKLSNKPYWEYKNKFNK